MKVLVLGAGGKTGGLVTERALALGHEVTVLLRDPSRFKISGVHEIVGDATSAADVARALRGQDAVIDTLGGTRPYKKQTLERTAPRNLIEAMPTEGARRLIVVSMMGIAESRAQSPWWYKSLLIPTFLRGSTADKVQMEAGVSASGLDYVIVRPPILKDGPSAGRAKVIGVGELGHAITRVDLAEFIVEQLSKDEYLGQAVTVVNS